MSVPRYRELTSTIRRSDPYFNLQSAPKPLNLRFRAPRIGRSIHLHTPVTPPTRSSQASHPRRVHAPLDYTPLKCPKPVPERRRRRSRSGYIRFSRHTRPRLGACGRELPKADESTRR